MRNVCPIGEKQKEISPNTLVSLGSLECSSFTSSRRLSCFSSSLFCLRALFSFSQHLEHLAAKDTDVIPSGDGGVQKWSLKGEQTYTRHSTRTITSLRKTYCRFKLLYIQIQISSSILIGRSFCSI